MQHEFLSTLFIKPTLFVKPGIKPVKILAVLMAALILVCLSTSTLAEQSYLQDDELVKLAKKFKDPATRYILARRFHRGTEYPQDKKQAAHWYLLAAKAGHIKAQYYLGRMYLQGDGIQKNYALGKKYLKQAAHQNHLGSMVELGDMYRLGDAGKKINHKNAVFWYKKAAKLDHSDAAFYLGTYLYEGRGIKQQKETAIEWLQLSAEQGYPAAEEYLNKLSSKKASKNSDASSTTKKANSSAKKTKRAPTTTKTQESDNSSKMDSPSPYKMKQTGASANKAAKTPEKKPKSTEDEDNDPYRIINRVDLREAKKGNVDAQYNVGMTFFESDTEFKAAAKWLRLAAEQDHAGAQFQLGIMYRDSLGVSKSESEAIKWLRLATSWGVTAAQHALGKLLRKQLIANEEELFKQNPELKDPEAQFTLGVMYTIGKGVERDSQSAIQWLQKAAMQNHSEAQYKLGEIYRNGDGVAADYLKAKEWLAKAAKLGNGRASSALQNILISEEQGMVEEQTKALANSPIYALINEAKKGTPQAKYKVGMMYVNGEDVASDAKKGVMWLERAAKDSDIRAQLALAELYLQGKKIKKNYKQAFHWYRSAADAGAVDAQFQIGIMFRRGIGVNKSNSQAVKWFRLAARQGHAKARKKLGGCRIC